MVDPISIGGAGKPGADLFKEANKSMQNASESVSKFEELRNKMESQDLSGIKNNNPNSSFQIQHQEQVHNVQQNQQAGQINQSQQVAKDIPKVTDMNGLQEVVNRLKAGQSRLKDLIDNATTKGKTFSPQELIGLQAEVSQITTEIQMCSKIVEQGVSAVKQTMQMQV